MLNSFPQGSSDPDALIATFERETARYSDAAISEAARRFTRGDVPGVSKTFSPSVAEFVDEVRKCHSPSERFGITPSAHAQSFPALPPPHKRPPFMRLAEKARAEHAHLPVLFEDINFDQWRRLSAAREVPVGAVWVACLGTVFGPEIKH